jgi:PiT family inorganic phosphate transporter
MIELLLLAGILLALLFNFVNGLNGAANSVATVVATRTLSPIRAIMLAATCNFLGPFLFTTAIARTLGTGILSPAGITSLLLLVAILSAAALVILATVSGLPISATHALVGGLIGAGIASYGTGILILPDPTLLGRLGTLLLPSAVGGALLFLLAAWLLQLPRLASAVSGALVGISLGTGVLMASGVFLISGLTAILLFLIVSPTLGFLAAFVVDLMILYLFRRSRVIVRRKVFKPLQVLASIFQALSHGAHDGQHAAGIITALLVAEGLVPTFAVPFWVTALSAAAIGLGTLFGGWDVIERLAKKITKIRPYQGFSASVSGGIILASMTSAGVPVSSTYVISGAIIGVGATRGRGAVDWHAVRSILGGWLITIPFATITSWILFQIVRLLG